MAVKPTNLAEWATGGSAPITEPLLAEKEAGWAPEFKPPAQWFNWWQNIVHLWIVWLDAFESEAHTWTALQTLSAGVTVTKGGTVGADAAVIATGPNGVGAAAVFGTAGSGTAAMGGRFVSTATSGYGALVDGVLAGLAAIGDAYGIYSEGGTLPGVYGFSASSHGLEGRGATVSGNAYGVRGEGGGSGNAAAGVYGLGSAAGAPGVIGQGAGSGGSGNGGNFYNSAAAAGGVAAANFVSTNANGVGGWGVGTGIYEGILAEASGNAPGLRAFRTGGPTALSVIKADGSIDLDDAVQPASNVGTKNLITKDCFPKFFALIQMNNTGSPTLLWGQNIDTISETGVCDLTVDFQEDFTALPGIVGMVQDVGGGFKIDARPVVVGSNAFVMQFFVAETGVQVGSSDMNNRRVFITATGPM